MFGEFLQGLSPMWLIPAALGVSFIIAFHELGHFAFALLFKMRVVKFSIGLGPKLLSFRRGGVEYQIAAIPFGGFVQIFGMTPLEEGAYEDPRSFINQTRWKRIIVYAAGPAFNYVLAAFLFFCAFWFYPGGDIIVSHVVPDTAASEAGLRSGDEIISINGRSVLSSEDFSEAVRKGKPLKFQVIHDEFRTKLVLAQNAVEKFRDANPEIKAEEKNEEKKAAAQARTVELKAKVDAADAALKAALAATAPAPAATDPPPDAELVPAPGPAAASDNAVAPEKEPPTTPEAPAVAAAGALLAAAQKDFDAHAGPRAELERLIGEARTALEVRTREQAKDVHVGRSAEVIEVTPRVTSRGALLGVLYFYEIDPARTPSFTTVAAYSVKLCFTQSVGTLRALGNIPMTKLFSKESPVSGPVGISKVLAQAANKGFRDFLKLIALLSLTLGLFNLLPIPALDGIKILFLGVETVARRDLYQTAQLWINAIGLLLLLSLIAVITVKDIFY